MTAQSHQERILDALKTQDLQYLRHLSAQPGGFSNPELEWENEVVVIPNGIGKKPKSTKVNSKNAVPFRERDSLRRKVWCFMLQQPHYEPPPAYEHSAPYEASTSTSAIPIADSISSPPPSLPHDLSIEHEEIPVLSSSSSSGSNFNSISSLASSSVRTELSETSKPTVEVMDGSWLDGQWDSSSGVSGEEFRRGRSPSSPGPAEKKRRRRSLTPLAGQYGERSRSPARHDDTSPSYQNPSTFTTASSDPLLPSQQGQCDRESYSFPSPSSSLLSLPSSSPSRQPLSSFEPLPSSTISTTRESGSESESDPQSCYQEVDGEEWSNSMISTDNGTSAENSAWLQASLISLPPSEPPESVTHPYSRNSSTSATSRDHQSQEELEEQKWLSIFMSASPTSTPTPTSTPIIGSETHQDESQIRLDTRRSFVSYPPRTSKSSRLQLQRVLHALIVTVFRKHPALRYFQGYHDIVSVMLLTFLPVEVLLLGADGIQAAEECWDEELFQVVGCVERLSLFRIRDGMSTGLEPVMALLRTITRVLTAVDPDLSEMVHSATPLPFFTLSWLLTLFSHDVDSFPIIQLLFDFILSHNPVMGVYISVAIIMDKKSEIEALREALEDDPGLLHSTLSQLPIFLPNLSPPVPPTPITSVSLSSPCPTPPKQLPLSPILVNAQTLYQRFPPFKSPIKVSDLLGPKSVIFTYEDEWSNADARVSMAEAEIVVGHMEWIVKPPPSDTDEGNGAFGGTGIKESWLSSKDAKKRRHLWHIGTSAATHHPTVTFTTGIAVIVVLGAVAFALYTGRAPVGSGGGHRGGVSAREWLSLLGVGAIVGEGVGGGTK